jgi:hypothetical protein
LDFFLESFFLVFSGGGGGCSSSSLSSSSPYPSSSSSSSSSLLLPPILFIFAPYRTFISTSKWTRSTTNGSIGSSSASYSILSSLLPWELSLSPSDACIWHVKLSQHYKWKFWLKWKQSQHKQKLNPNQTHSPIVHQHVQKDAPCHAPSPY